MGKVRVVVTDANIIINLIHTGYLSLFAALDEFSFVVPDEVVSEILYPEHAQTLQEALDAAILERVSIADTEELELFAMLTTSLGRGEAACLALAQRHGWLIASDEGGAFRREVNQRLGVDRVINTPGLFLLSIRAGILSIEQADQAKAVLEQNRFRIKINSFRDLLN
jgi:predicted nucleic acid-binding protein